MINKKLFPILIILMFVLTNCKTPMPLEKLTNTYNNPYLGITLNHPDNMESNPVDGYKKNHLEGVSFETKGPDSKFVLLIDYQKFNKEEHYEYSWDELESIDSNEIITLVSAMPQPTEYKVDNMAEVTINNFNYYLYSFKIENKIDHVLIKPNKNSYFIFRFQNLDPKLIAKILKSVKYTGGVYLDTFENHEIVENPAIGLEIVHKPKTWTHRNTNESTILEYQGDLGSAKVEIKKQERSELFKYLKERSKAYPAEWQEGIVNTDEEDTAYLKSHFGCESVETKVIVSKQKTLTCIMPNKERFTYLGEFHLYVKSKYIPKDKNNALNLYIREIENSFGYYV